MIAAIVETCGHRPLVTVAVSLALAVVAGLYALHTLTFVSSHLRLLPQHERYVVRLKEYQREFGELNDIVVVVESPTADLSKDYAARLTRELRQAGLTSPRITYRVDPAYFDHRALLYLSVDDLTKLRDRCSTTRNSSRATRRIRRCPGSSRDSTSRSPIRWSSGSSTSGLGGERSTDLRFLESVIDQISARLDGKSDVRVSLGRRLLGGPIRRSRRRLLLLVRPPLAVRARAGRGRLRGATGDDRGHPQRHRAPRGATFPDVRAGVTGGPAISNDEMATAFDDSKVATASGLRAHARAPAGRVPARRQAGAHAGDTGREPRPGRSGSSPSSSVISASSR